MSFSFLPSFWTTLMFWTELSVGCLIVVLLQYLTGGRWGVAALPFLRAGIAASLLLLPGFLVLPFGLAHIFPWAGGFPPDLAGRTAWLHPSAFLLRTLAYLATFALAAIAVLRWRRPEAPSWAGPLLVGLIGLVSIASTDWMLSVDSGFASTLYPFIYASGAFVAVFSGLAFVMSRRPGTDARLLSDFGKLLFAALCFWGYIQLSQLLIVWTGNLPHEASWYVDRTSHGWKPFTVALFLLHLALPFALLLSHELKRDPRRLAWVAAGVFAGHYLAVFWLTAPRTGMPLRFDPFDLLLPLAMGWIWLWGFRNHLQREESR